MVIDQLLKVGIRDVDQTTAEEAMDRIVAVLKAENLTAIPFTWGGDRFEVVLRTNKTYDGSGTYSYLWVLDAPTRNHVPDIVWRRVMMALTSE